MKSPSLATLLLTVTYLPMVPPTEYETVGKGLSVWQQMAGICWHTPAEQESSGRD